MFTNILIKLQERETSSKRRDLVKKSKKNYPSISSYLTVAIEKNIAGFNVAMDDPVFVLQVVECFYDGHTYEAQHLLRNGFILPKSLELLKTRGHQLHTNPHLNDYSLFLLVYISILSSRYQHYNGIASWLHILYST